MNTPINEAVELLPCPFCGAVPDAENDATFQLTDGVKYGAVNCCGTGPEVRTDYKDVSHWKHAAIEAWNSRAALPPPIVEPVKLPVFTPGTVYQSNSYGPLVFKGLDTYCGQVTYEFKEGRSSRYIGPERMEREFLPVPTTPASTLGQQVARAQAEVATWSPEKRASVRLEGSGQYTTASAPSDGAADARDAWQPIETAPKNGRTILLGAFNLCGKWRTMRGQWFAQEEIDQDWEEPDGFEAGWYETSVEADVPNCWRISPTHWQPLPGAPVASTRPTTGGEKP